jgi:hypothetical protein
MTEYRDQRCFTAKHMPRVTECKSLNCCGLYGAMKGIVAGAPKKRLQFVQLCSQVHQMTSKKVPETLERIC